MTQPSSNPGSQPAGSALLTPTLDVATECSVWSYVPFSFVVAVPLIRGKSDLAYHYTLLPSVTAENVTCWYPVSSIVPGAEQILKYLLNEWGSEGVTWINSRNAFLISWSYRGICDCGLSLNTKFRSYKTDKITREGLIGQLFERESTVASLVSVRWHFNSHITLEIVPIKVPSHKNLVPSDSHLPCENWRRNKPGNHEFPWNRVLMWDLESVHLPNEYWDSQTYYGVEKESLSLANATIWRNIWVQWT